MNCGRGLCIIKIKDLLLHETTPDAMGDSDNAYIVEE